MRFVYTVIGSRDDGCKEPTERKAEAAMKSQRSLIIAPPL
jgi:hypothetical protein